MIVPVEHIPGESLENLVEAFVLREGTDYGEAEFSLEEKKQQVLEQLHSKQVVVIYSEAYESFDIRPAAEFE